MDAVARETENALKKELVEVKDQVIAIKERIAKVRDGKCLVHRREVARRAATDRRAYC
jgi:cell division protein FtsB